MHTQPLSVITSNDHRSHDPEFDIYSGSLVGRFEVPQRVDRIREALADGPFEMQLPATHGIEPVLRVHNPDHEWLRPNRVVLLRHVVTVGRGFLAGRSGVGRHRPDRR